MLRIGPLGFAPREVWKRYFTREVGHGIVRAAWVWNLVACAPARTRLIVQRATGVMPLIINSSDGFPTRKGVIASNKHANSREAEQR